ncbi:MAG: VTC domain-containing protein [Lachnospiraceae bacterium]
MGKVKAKGEMTFERHEKKFLMTLQQYEELLEELLTFMEFDEYGRHTIHTVYFDTDDFEVIRHSLSKPTFKEKMRLRSYGEATCNSPVYFELKKKLLGVTYKRRVQMSYLEAVNYLRYHEPPLEKTQIFAEIDAYMQQEQVRPKVLISYDRVAMRGREDPNFRITFDQNIRYSTKKMDVSHIEEDALTLLEREPLVLMEIKVPGAYPLEMSRLLSRLGLFKSRYSKFGMVYSRTISPVLTEKHIETASAALPAREEEKEYAREYIYE